MRITIVQGPFYPVPPLLGGAIEKAWFDLGREFAARGHRVTHISRGFGALAPSERIDGVEHQRIRSHNAPRSRILFRLFDLIYSARALKVMPAADITITNSVWLPILIRDSRYGALYVHVGRYPKRQMWLYRHAARLQTVSNAAAEAIVRQTPRCAGQVRVIPYPVAQSSEGDEAKDYWSGREKTLLYAGRIHPEKGLEILLNAFARFISSAGSSDKDGWRLVLVGPSETSAGGGGARFYRHLREIAAPMGDRVEWRGPVFDRDLLSSFYRRAGLFVYPSVAETGETLGLAPLEAMAAGCPALVSALPCFADYIVDMSSGFVFDHRAADPATALAAKLAEITSAGPLIEQVAAQALRAASRFALPRVAEMFLDDFAEIVKSSSRKILVSECDQAPSAL